VCVCVCVCVVVVSESVKWWRDFRAVIVPQC